jgi:3-hydroxyisobutyrate dehydrogenase-like beta-hydroxyacid dehydrogenase
MAKTAFIGLGVMGGPMAGHLARAGHDVAVYNRTEDKARDWAQKHKGRTYTSVAAAASNTSRRSRSLPTQENTMSAPSAAAATDV